MKIVIRRRSRTAAKNVFFNPDLFDTILAHLVRIPTLEVGKSLCDLACVNKRFKRAIDDARNKHLIETASKDIHIDCEITEPTWSFRAKIRLTPSWSFYWLIGMTNQKSPDNQEFLARLAKVFGDQLSGYRRTKALFDRSCIVSVLIDTDALREGKHRSFDAYLKNLVTLKQLMNQAAKIRALKIALKKTDNKLRIESRLGFFSRMHERTGQVFSQINKA